MMVLAFQQPTFGYFSKDNQMLKSYYGCTVPNGTVSFQSGELSPNADNDAVDAGLSGTVTSRVTQSIENTGTETAYYAGWVGRDDGTVPTDTGVRNFLTGAITIPGNKTVYLCESWKR